MKKRGKLKLKVTAAFSLLIAALIVFTAVLTAVRYKNGVYITQFGNSGHSQMMGYAVKTHGGKTILIDGGADDDAQNAIDFIEKSGGKVDYWFITHPHKDHASVIEDVIENTDIEIDKILYTANETEWYEKYEPARANEAARFYKAINNERISKNCREVTLGENFDIDNVKISILGVKNPEITANAFNNSSMVFKMSVNGKSILFLGDTGAESSEKLIDTYGAELASYAVQMAHHGQNGGTEELYRLVSPKICFWPTPDWLWENDSGSGKNTGPWKTLETRKWIEELGVRKNVIEKDGNQTVHIW